MKKQRLFPVYIVNLFLTIPYAILLYINSSYLETLMSSRTLGILYIAAAVIEVLILVNISKILRAMRLKALFILFAAIELVATALIGFIGGAVISGISFVLLDSFSFVALFCLDIFLEEGSEDERTGTIRSSYLMMMNTAILVSPLIAGFVVGPNAYWKAYLLSALFLAILILLARKLLHNIPARAKDTTIRIHDAWKSFRAQKDIWRIFISNFLLQFFYAWMVIYIPLYLHNTLGLGWSTIGIVLTVMLLPFVMFEVPVGKLADTVLGEKELLVTGFFVMAAFAVLIPFVPIKNLLMLAFVLFMTRVGASFVEVTTESYFFKHVNSKQEGFIGLFRLAEPLAYITGPLVAFITLSFVPLSYLFVVLACIMLIGIGYGLAIRDTK